nr:DyP-type peroxidase [Auricularia mesenterica]
MHLTLLFLVLPLFSHVAPVTAALSRAAAASLLKGKRRFNMLKSAQYTWPPAGEHDSLEGRYSWPSPSSVSRGLYTVSRVELRVGMKKKDELFYFFRINSAVSFKNKLGAMVQQVTSAQQLLSTSTQPLVALNIAFSQTGLQTLNITANLADTPFSRGQFADAAFLGDPQQGANWLPAFKGTSIHGVFIMASDDQTLLDAQVTSLELTMGNDMSEACQSIRCEYYN